jgi:hypothetical protein
VMAEVIFGEHVSPVPTFSHEVPQLPGAGPSPAALRQRHDHVPQMRPSVPRG